MSSTNGRQALPLSSEWLLVQLTSLFAPDAALVNNYVRFTKDARGMSAIVIMKSALKIWLSRNSQPGAKEIMPPFVLVSADCRAAVAACISAGDTLFTEELLRVLFEATTSVPQLVLQGGAPYSDSSIAAVAVLFGAFVDLLAETRGTGTIPLPFLDHIDATTFLTHLSECISAQLIDIGVVTALVRDLMGNVSSTRASDSANWINGILSAFLYTCSHDVLSDGDSHHPFLASLLDASLENGMEACWRLWRRHLHASMRHATKATADTMQSAPLIETLVRAIQRVGTLPSIVCALERMLRDDSRFISPYHMLCTLFDFVAGPTATSPTSPSSRGDVRRSPLFRRGSVLTREESNLVGRSSVFSKCVLHLMLGFAKSDMNLFVDRFLLSYRRDVFETVRGKCQD